MVISFVASGFFFGHRTIELSKSNQIVQGFTVSFHRLEKLGLPCICYLTFVLGYHYLFRCSNIPGSQKAWKILHTFD